MSIAFHFRSITLLLLFTLSLGVHAQFSVTGRVVNSSDNSGLPGATIELLGSNRGTVTDFNGNFTISEIVSQKAELRISYLGFRLLIEKLDFSDKKNLKVLIRLDEATADLKQVDVVAQSEGQVQAMLRQREANSIKNVISAEQIKQFPDVNAAEVVQRIPGITVQRDQGEGRFVQLRGTAPEFTNFSINGEQIASPEGGARYVGLDVIAADQIELIEVTKVPTPDMDGDGISGNVNIITRSARDTIPDIIASISGGYNNLMKTGNQQLQFSFGQRHKKLGVQINTSYYRNSQGSHNMEFDYTRGPLLSQAQDTTNKDNFYILYKDIELRHYTILRQRTGLSTNLDYRFNRNHQIYLRGMYNSFSDDEQRRRISYKFSDANDLLIYREASIEHDVKDRIKTQEISALNLGGEHVIGNGLKLDYEVAYSVASEKQPDRMLASFDNGGITMAIDNSDLKWPRISYPFYEDSLDAATLKNYEFNDLQFYKELTKDRTYTARFNLEIPYLTNSSSRHSGFLKFGAKFRMKEKVRENSARAFNKYFQKVSLYSQTGPVLNLTTIEDAFREDNLLNQAYDINHMIGVDNMREFYEEYPQLFKYDEIETWSRTYGQDYKAHEDIYALYGMFSHNIGKLLIIGGLRYEMTQIDNQGIDAGVDYPAGGILYADTIYDKRTQNFLLPQLQFKYALNPLTNFRAAITYTYTRPNFDDIIPFRESEDDEVTIGNPSLKYPLSMNIDLLAETYLKNNGILSGGVFYKKIENIAFNFVRNAHMGTDFNRYGLMEITMAVNGQDANVFGAETQAQFKLSFLPGLLANLGIYGNYTFTQSSATITKRYPQNENNKVFIFNEDNAEFFTSSGETETIQMPGQAQHAGNFALYYDNKRIYAKLSANFHSPYLIELGNDAGLDVYYDQSFHLDFNANYQVNKVLNIFADVVNLTNEPQRYYMGSTDYFKKQEYYSWWGRLGLKINL